MKLRNKKSGEIKECVVIPVDESGYPNEYQVFEKGESLAELNEEWEDAPEEPKEYWVVDYITCGVDKLTYDAKDPEMDDFNKVIGNFFETEEEAKLAVEKLKALAEAKKDGLKIKGYYYNHEDLVILADIGKCNKLTLDTLFGKEID